MQIEKETVDCLSQQFPELYDMLLKIEAKGILVCVSAKVDKTLDETLVVQIKKFAKALLEHAERKLERISLPILYFLLYEEDGLRMEVAYTTKKYTHRASRVKCASHCFKRYTHRVSRIKCASHCFKRYHLLHLPKKHIKEMCGVQNGMLRMNFQGRKCVCHWVCFGK